MLTSLNDYLLNKGVTPFSLAAVVILSPLCLLFGGVVVIGVLSLGSANGVFGGDLESLSAEPLWMWWVLSLLPNLLLSLLLGYWLKRRLLVSPIDIAVKNETTNEAAQKAILRGIPDLLVHITEDGQSLRVVSQEETSGALDTSDALDTSGALSIDGQQRTITKGDGEAPPREDRTKINPLSLFQEALSPEQVAERMQSVRQAISTGEQQINDYKSTVGEKIFYEEVRIVKIGPHEALMMIRDITERKRIEKDQKYALSLLTATLESTAEGILSVTCFSDVLAYNQKFLQMWDIPASLLAPGSCPKARFQGLAEKTMDPAGFIARAIEISKSPPDEVALDLLEMKNGRIFERHSQAQKVDGEPIGRIWTYRDVTEKKRAAAAIEAANRNLKRLANLDGLTQVANRRYFDSYLGQQWKAALRDQQPLSLILFDVDFFKGYNDHYGHLAGDRCLKIIAKETQVTVHRPADLVARYGGEEFAIILPETPVQGAIAITQQIQTAIQSLKIDHATSEVSALVTVSLGIACVIPQANTPVATLIKGADTALYDAKRQGRNRYALHSNACVNTAEV